MKPIKRWQLSLLTCLALMACINVDDFGVYWNEGTLDPQLEGSWMPEKQAADQCLRFKKNKDSYQFDNGDKEVPDARTLAIGSYSFLMVKKPKEKDGQLYKYTATKDSFVIYQLNKEKKEDFLKKYNTSNVVFENDVVKIKVLNKPSIAMLRNIAAQDNYWQVLTAYKHSDCTPVREGK
jgi:hypothetical protein